MKARILLIGLALGSSSCADYQARLAAQRAAQQQATEQTDDATCRGYGAQPGSEGYIACRMNLANNRAAAEQVAAINQQRQSEALLGASAVLLSH